VDEEAAENVRQLVNFLLRGAAHERTKDLRPKTEFCHRPLAAATVRRNFVLLCGSNVRKDGNYNNAADRMEVTAKGPKFQISTKLEIGMGGTENLRHGNYRGKVPRYSVYRGTIF
jgi:hypothetical protein